MIYRLTKAKAGLECTVSGLESILSFPSRSSCGIMWYLAKRSILAFPCAKFSTRVDLDLPLRFFVLRPLGCFDDTTQKILVSFRAVVLCQDLGIQDLAPVSHKCTRVWLGVDSGVPVRKQTRHHASTLRSSRERGTRYTCSGSGS